MSSKSKKLSNPFSTGGGGAHFEAHVQASFVALMLTGGYAPCLPCCPIVGIKLQGKIDGYDTDDLIVVVENPDSKKRRKLLGQVKHSISITQGSELFGEVMQAAWNDFNNPEIFTKGQDGIALITGPISATDEHNVQWLLNQAKHTKDVDEFFRNVEQARFSPSKSEEKLQAIQHHLKAANNGQDVNRADLYSFLRHFYLLGYDLGSEGGVVLPLLHSHIAQFYKQYPQWAWSRVVDIVQTWNQGAGTITPQNLPDDLLEAFKQKAVTEMPKEFKVPQGESKTDWKLQTDASFLALAVLLGSWNEKGKNDIGAVTHLLGIDYDTWQKKAREILHYPGSPLSLKNGIWELSNRSELWNLLGSRILDKDLDTFKSLAVSVLKEPNPAFELPAEERFAASIHGRVPEHSDALRRGIAEGLAILGSQPEACSHCSEGKAEATSALAIREILSDADWVLWGSLNNLLPTLAEGSPGEFLNAVDRALSVRPCPFDELFAQEGDGITGGNYLTGLLWALEALAWDEQYLVRVCVALGDLASHDPGGQWANRPSNSLTTILLPWLPQTLASIDKREVAMQTLLKECPDIAWNLLIRLLPGQHEISSGSYKPNWRRKIPEDWGKKVTAPEYWQQAFFFAELAVSAAGYDVARLSELIDHFDHLPEPAFNRLLEVLASKSICELPEDQRVLLWDHLNKFTNKHRRFSDAKWALKDDLVSRIEHVAEELAPTNPFNLHQYLFSDQDFDLYEENDNWEEQQRKLDERREKAIIEIFKLNGIDGVIRFAESVVSAIQVGYALGAIADDLIELTLLPVFLDAKDSKHRDLVRGFIWKRYHTNGWSWCDKLEKSGWNPQQLGCFLVCLPFNKETWNHVSEWLNENQGEYWSRVGTSAGQVDEDFSIAVEKLIEYGRPYSAIYCLYRMLHAKQAIEADQCVRALMAALPSSEPTHTTVGYHVVELIKFLQSEPTVAEEDLFKVEWAYLPLLDHHRGASPKLLERKLADDPEFFCEVIRRVYRSKKEGHPQKEPTEESKAILANAWRLLHEWKTPPGTQDDGAFSAEHFNEWLLRVKTLCTESGHLEVALISLGQVLIHAPSELDGLWIHPAVAEALNGRDAEDMRSGFRTGTYNSRGVHWVDPTGQPERDLAEDFRRKAEAVENAGFQRLAVTLRGLAEGYEKEAERIISEHKKEDLS